MDSPLARYIAAKLNQDKDLGTIEHSPLVLEHHCASESPGKLVKIPISGPLPPRFLIL